MRYRRNKSKAKIVFFLTLLFLTFIAGYYAGKEENISITYLTETKSVEIISYVNYSEFNTSYASIVIPAVDKQGNGVQTVLSVQVVQGNGKVLANIDRLLFWTDTQNSIRTATKVASEVTGIDTSKYDIIYTLITNASAVEGPSAGAAITIATIAALRGKKLNPNVMITGTINHDGTIGPVGNILEKARLAKSLGAKILLVPLLQSRVVTYETNSYCEKIGFTEICTTERIPRKIDISEEVGIRVVEIENIEDAMKYFFD